MHINCIICSDLFLPSSEIYVTRCGHAFHYVCLLEWIERSKSCPQCRHKTSDKNITRIFFNVPEGITEDSGALQNRIDNLNFQIRLKDMDIKNAQVENETLKSQNKGLREEIRSTENKINLHDTTITALKTQITYLRKESKKAEEALNEVKTVRSQLEKLKRVETIVAGSASEVEDMLNSYSDTYESKKALATYVSILKKEMHAESEKKRHFRERLRESQDNNSTLSCKYNELLEERHEGIKVNSQLKDDLQHMENENKSLQRKVREFEAAILSPTASNPKDKLLRRLLKESPAPETINKQELIQPHPDENVSPPLLKDVTTEPKNELTFVKSETPLHLKSRSIGVTPLKQSTSSQVPYKYNFLKKAKLLSTCSSTSVTASAYNGLGGHDKIDFDIPQCRTLKIKRIKRIQSTSNPKINAFFNAS